MITRIVSYSFLAMLFFAFFLAILGVKHISTGEEYYSFMASISQRFENWKIEIPNVPSIDRIDEGGYDDSGLILQVLIKIANFFVNLVNVLIRLFNIVILLLNIFIQLIQFVCTFLFSMKDFVERLKDLNIEARTIV